MEINPPIKAEDLYQYLLHCEYKDYLAQMERRRLMAKLRADWLKKGQADDTKD